MAGAPKKPESEKKVYFNTKLHPTIREHIRSKRNQAMYIEQLVKKDMENGTLHKHTQNEA